MTGSYAFVVMHKSHPGELYAIRKKSPLIAAETKDGLVFASDVTAAYKALGCTLAEEINERLAEEEPCDIQLELAL